MCIRIDLVFAFHMVCWSHFFLLFSWIYLFRFCLESQKRRSHTEPVFLLSHLLRRRAVSPPSRSTARFFLSLLLSSSSESCSITSACRFFHLWLFCCLACFLSLLRTELGLTTVFSDIWIQNKYKAEKTRGVLLMNDPWTAQAFLNVSFISATLHYLLLFKYFKNFLVSVHLFSVFPLFIMFFLSYFQSPSLKLFLQSPCQIIPPLVCLSWHWPKVVPSFFPFLHQLRKYLLGSYSCQAFWQQDGL